MHQIPSKLRIKSICLFLGLFLFHSSSNATDRALAHTEGWYLQSWVWVLGGAVLLLLLLALISNNSSSDS